MPVSHINRIKEELTQAGLSRYALLRAEGRNLHNYIHQGEHIQAAVYGRAQDGAAMLVATDRRLIFYDKKPMVTISDEISYEVVSGVGVSQENGFRASITLFTRMGEYTIRLANPYSVNRFKMYLEQNRLEGSPQPDTRRTKPISNRTTNKPQASNVFIDNEANDFLKHNELGVLSTLDQNNYLHGAVVYYIYNEEMKTIHVLTKSQTKKSHNILSTHQIAFTVFDESKLQTVQIQGSAEIEPDHELKQKIYLKINRLRKYKDNEHHPPVTKLTEGHFIVFRINISSAYFSDFKYRQ